MTVFISWSGKRSKAIAHVFKKHLEYVIQGLPTFMSDKDIASGTQWFQEISDKLREASFGIVCVTPENLDQPWLSFEAGALGNQAQRSRVVPVVYDMSKEDLPSPLSGFNAVDLDEEGFVRLIQSIHEARAVPTAWPIIEAAARREWPDIESELAVIPEPTKGADPAPSFNLENAFKEMRGLLRDLVDRQGTPRSIIDTEADLANERQYLRGGAGVGIERFGRPTSSITRELKRLLHAYQQGDDSAHKELRELGFDPEKRSALLDLIAREDVARARATGSTGHDNGHLA